MKTIERQIRNHEFEIVIDPDPHDPANHVASELYVVDGVRVHRHAFFAAIALLSAEAPK